jgi:phosphatidylethanolamine-binding protein (PEBP) family uncharacterized protein
MCLCNIPNNIDKLEEGIKILPAKATIEKNSWSEKKYSGPCPSKLEHRYYFKLFALNKRVGTKSEISSINIKQLITPYIIDETILICRYKSNNI